MVQSLTPLLAQAPGYTTTMPGMLAWVAVGAAGACVLWYAAVALCRGSGLHAPKVAAVACVSFALKLVILAAAISSPAYEPKGAAHVPLELWANAREFGAAELLADPTFTLPALAAAPAFEVFGPEPAFIPITNCIAIGIGAIAVAAALARCAGNRPAWWAFFWLMWNPASVYWGMHGLRDPFIFMALCFCAVGLVRLSTPAERGGGIAAGLRSMAVSVVLLAALRPEVLLIPLGCTAAAGLLVPAARPLRAAVAVVAVLAVLVVPLVMRDQLGIDQLSSDSIEQVAHSRIERASNERAGGAGASNFFQPGDDFLLQDFQGRLETQFIGLVACPYPLAPRGAADWTVAAESAVWVAALVVPFLPWARGRCSATALRLARVGALCALAGLAMYAPLTVNAGNAFRLRYSLLPLASIGLVLVLVPAPRRRMLIVLNDDVTFHSTPRAA